MKFFAYTVGALALAAVALADSKEDLIKDATKLRGEAAGAIEKLKGEGKHFLAHEIEVIEHEVEVLEHKVHDFHPQTSVGQIGLHAAETVLHSLEERLKHKLADLNKNFDTSKEELAKDAAKLKGEAAGAIEKLKSEGKHVLAHEIEVIEHEVEVLEHKVHDFHPQTSIGQIGLHAAENILHGLEERLKHKLADLNKNFDNTKTKEELAKDAAKLKEEAGSAVTTLKSQGKHFLAHEIELLEHEIEVIEHKIEGFHPQTQIGQVGLHAAETVLHSLEERLKTKIAELNKNFDSTKDKEELIKDATKLRGEAAGVIDKLKKEGKGFLAHEIEVIEHEVEVLEHKVHDFHPQTSIGQVGLHAAETVLHSLEERLKHKMAELNHNFDSKDNKDKEELKKDAAKLRAEAHTEIEKLKSEGKHTLAQELEILEKSIEKVESTIEHAHPQTEIGKIALHSAEHVLKSLEEKLQHKIKSLNH